MAHFAHQESSLLSALRSREISVGVPPDAPDTIASRMQEERLRAFYAGIDTSVPSSPLPSPGRPFVRHSHSSGDVLASGASCAAGACCGGDVFACM